MFKFKKEVETDSNEYKQHMYSLCEYKCQRYSTQMNNRLLIGKGKCKYFIGVADNGDIIGFKTIIDLLLSLSNILKLIKNLNVHCQNIKIIYFENTETYILIVDVVSYNQVHTSPNFITFTESDDE